MAAKPLSTEAIALTEKKMDMTLDDIIKMSRTSYTPNARRVSNKAPKAFNNQARDKSATMKQFMNSRASLRQGVLVQKRSSFQTKQFPLATENARKAVSAPLQPKAINCNRDFNWNQSRVRAPLAPRKAANGGFSVKKYQQEYLPRQQQAKVNVVEKQRPQTLDSLFSSMVEQRLRLQESKFEGFGQQRQQKQQKKQQQQHRGRGRFGYP